MKLNKLSLVFVLFLSLTLFSCNDDENEAISSNYVSFDAKDKSFALVEDEDILKDINIYTNDISGVDRTFMIEVAPLPVTIPPLPPVNPENFTLPATVVVPANSNKGTIKFGIKNVSLSSVKEYLNVRITRAAGISAGNDLLMSFVEVCNLNTVVFNLTLDAYGSETTWTLYDSNLEVLFSGGPYTDGGTAGPAQTWCLPNGDYTFLIEDSYGDGIAPSGSYKLTRVFSDGSPSVILAQGSAFAQFETKTFTLN